MSRTVLFLTAPDDLMVMEFAAASNGYEAAFPFALRANADWCVAWVNDENGEPQVLLRHIPSGQLHFLGTDAQEAMQSAVRIITEWDKLEESLAVQ